MATTAVIAGVSDAVFREARTIENESLSKQSYFTSESGVEDVAYRIKTEKSVSPTEHYVIDSTTADVTISTAPDGSEQVTSDGDASGTKRTTTMLLNQGSGVSFPYALSSGLGGIDLAGGSSIIGDIYTH